MVTPSLIRKRIRELDRLESAEDGLAVDLTTRQNLESFRDKGAIAPDAITIRTAFIRRVKPLDPSEIKNQRIVDRPRPTLPRRPPLSLLTSLPKGVALRTELTLLFVAQSNPSALTGRGKLTIPALSRNAHSEGLADLVAVDAQHSVNPELAADFTTSRHRQIKNALAKLTEDDLALVDLPHLARGKSGFADVRMHAEIGGRPAAPYEPPLPNAEIVEIPVDFYLNGWIHVLTSSEIAMWLMLRDLTSQQTRTSNSGWVQINATDRLLHYDLTRSAWDTHKRLEAFGLIKTHRDRRRRTNGTVIGGQGQASNPHTFWVDDTGLKSNALTTVREALTAELDN